MYTVRIGVGVARSKPPAATRRGGAWRPSSACSKCDHRMTHVHRAPVLAYFYRGGFRSQRTFNEKSLLAFARRREYNGKDEGTSPVVDSKMRA